MTPDRGRRMTPTETSRLRAEVERRARPLTMLALMWLAFGDGRETNHRPNTRHYS